jgi:acyl-CoA synthetase (AMP-forming)/AMP-acid ligase II
MARFKRPKDYRFVDARPTNNDGKVVKREPRDLLRADTVDNPDRIARRPVS